MLVTSFIIYGVVNLMKLNAVQNFAVLRNITLIWVPILPSARWPNQRFCNKFSLVTKYSVFFSAYFGEYGIIGEINGFVQLSARVEESDRKFFCDYPPLFKHSEITRDMMVPKMREYATKYSHFETKQKLLVSSFFVDNTVMSTTYARFLLGIGVTLYGVKKIIQFRSSPCLAPFIRTMVERRRDGDRTNNPLLSDWAKSGINNCKIWWKIENQFVLKLTI